MCEHIEDVAETISTGSRIEMFPTWEARFKNVAEDAFGKEDSERTESAKHAKVFRRRKTKNRMAEQINETRALERCARNFRFGGQMCASMQRVEKVTVGMNSDR